MKELRPDDYTKLIYLHSNRTMDFQLFKDKFFPGKSNVAAWKLIKRLEKPGNDFVEIEQRTHFEKAVIRLTRKAITELRDKHLALVTYIHPVSINWNLLPHHHRVVALRIVLERAPQFTDVFWVSDYEMNCGIGGEAKWKFRVMDLLAREEYSRTWKAKNFERVPDGYFEAIVGEKHIPFVLEYEHQPYSREKVFGIIYGLEKDFGSANKLFVCKDEEHTIRLNNLIWTSMDASKRQSINRKLWLITDFDSAIKKPIEEAFKPIEKPRETQQKAKKKG